MVRTYPVRKRKPQQTEFSCRSMELRSSTFNADTRTVEAVLTTETPVPMWDRARREVVPEILTMDGMKSPAKVPFLNAHSRLSVEDVIGSVSNIQRENEQAVGTIRFAADAEGALAKVRDGHITDVSVGYENQYVTYVPAGKSHVIGSREYVGPANVVTSWKLKEVSLVPIGADELAKLRGYNPDQLEKGFEMDEKLRAFLVQQGMPNDLTDEAAQEWATKNLAKPVPQPQRDEAAEEARQHQAFIKALEEVEKKRKLEQAAFRAEVDTLCKMADCQDYARELYDLEDITKVREAILKRKAEGSPDIRIVPGPASVDKFRDLAGTALTLRALRSSGGRQATIDRLFPVEKRAKGWEEFANAGLLDIARDCLEVDGLRTRGLTREQIAIAALGFPSQIGLRYGDPAYHVTGSFANLTADAINKSMMVGYTEFPATWLGPMRQGSSVPDFKTINRYRIGAVANLPVWPDNQNPQKGSFADAKESYAVEARSMELSFSYRLIINDDMDALSRLPQQMGQAASRTVNAVAWAQITSNPTMSDSVALFSTATGARKRANTTSGAATPTVATIQTMTNQMMQMRGENTPEGNESDDILALEPRYIVGPSALRTTIENLLNSVADPASTNAGSANVVRDRNLIKVIEPLLDANSATAWYLFADPGQIDTVEVTFLQGQESPVVRSFEDPRNLAMNYTVLQTFAAKAMNHRGIIRHAGA